MATIRYTKNGDYSAQDSTICTVGGETDLPAGTLNAYFVSGDVFLTAWALSTPTGTTVLESADGMPDSSRDAIFADFSDVTDGVELNGGDMGDVLVGGSGNDNLYGNTGDDTLEGGLGVDTLLGGTGDDTLIASATEVDTLIGGSGSDTADFRAFEGGVYAGIGRYSTQEEDGNVTNGTMSNVENLTGGDGDDYLAGDAQANVLRGGAGDDVLVGYSTDGYPALGGADSLYGEDGDDAIIMFDDTAVVDGGAGNDVIDVAFQTLVVGADTVIRGVEAFRVGPEGFLDLSARTSADATILISPMAQNSFKIIGSQGDDRIAIDFSQAQGSSDAARVSGPDQASVSVLLDGGAGFDTLDFSSFPGSPGSTSGTGISLNQGAVINIEAVIGTAFDDAIEGSDSDNTLDGGAGDDTLSGLDGDDLLIGGDGNNRLVGGLGLDTVSYDGTQIGIVANLQQRFVTRVVGGTDGPFAVDTLSSVENIVGSDAADRIRGGARASNVLDGGDGGDRLSGQSGDTLIGGAGDDTLTLVGELKARGDTVVLGGGGDDRLTLKGGFFVFDDDSFSRVERVVLDDASVDLSNVGVNGDATGVRITFAGQTGGRVIGTLFGDTIIGGGGDDVINGGGGADRMVGSGPDQGDTRDVFAFSSIGDMSNENGRTDRISHFGAQDLIDLSQIDANPELEGIQGFTFVEVFSGEGTDAEVMVRMNREGNFTVLFDLNNDGSADASFHVLGAMPTEQNFLLVAPTAPEFG